MEFIMPWSGGHAGTLRSCLVVCMTFVAALASPPMPAPKPFKVFTGKFWQITDIHWDQRYSENGDPAKMCHTTNDPAAHNSMWGNYLCDSPWPLVKSSIQAMVDIEPQPEFILWTGDNAPHTDDPAPDFSVIFNTVSNITNELRTAFHPSIPILPVLGNHDSYPKDDYPIAGKEFYGKYLSQGGWATLLPAEAQQEFEQGGYYSYTLPSGVMVLVVNTNLYYAFNTLGRNVPDPCDQFAWLRSKLQIARDENSKVIVAAHAPPGFFERKALVPFFNHSYNDAYIDLLNDFGENILVQIYGHEHTDSFKLFLGPKGEVESVALLAPSVTPWHASVVFGGTAVNPSLRLYHYTPAAIVDYFQYHLNLSKVITPPGDALNLTGESTLDLSLAGVSAFDGVKPQWELFYEARKTYGLSSLNILNMAGLYDRLVRDDALFQKYYLINSAGYDDGLCDDSCKKNHLCAIAYLKVDALFPCMESNLTKSHILSQEYLLKYGKDLGESFSSSSVSQLVITLVMVSMALTVVLAIILAVMLIMIVVKRSRMVPTESSYPILDLAKNNKRNYRKLP